MEPDPEAIKSWASAAAIRALKTMAQTAIGVIGASAVLSDVSWGMVLSASALACIMSFLTSIAGIPEVQDGSSLSAMRAARSLPTESGEEDQDGGDQDQS